MSLSSRGWFAQLRTGRPQPYSAPAPGAAGAALVGLLYIASSWWGSALLAKVGLPVSVTLGQVREKGAWVVVLEQLPIVTSLLVMLAFAYAYKWWSRLGLRSTRDTVAVIVSAAVFAALCWFLNMTDVWPYQWRWREAANLRGAHALLQAGGLFPLALWIGVVAIGRPLLEEIAFRFGALTLLGRLGVSPVAAILLSASAFALAHVYPAGPVTPLVARRVAAAFMFGIAAAAATVVCSGKISVAVGAHVGRSLLEIMSLLMAANASL